MQNIQNSHDSQLILIIIIIYQLMLFGSKAKWISVTLSVKIKPNSSEEAMH